LFSVVVAVDELIDVVVSILVVVKTDGVAGLDGTVVVDGTSAAIDVVFEVVVVIVFGFGVVYRKMK
jgi:hypothetical protein